MATAHGYPIVSATDAYRELALLGIRPWSREAPTQPLETYLDGDLTPAQQTEAARFAPKVEVDSLRTPAGQPFTAFRSLGKSWATTFVLLPNPDGSDDPLVVLVGEYKHGIDAVSLVPPSGVMSRADQSMDDVAAREFEEETGLALVRVISLAPAGRAVSSRQSDAKYYPYLGIAAEPVVRGPSKLDDNEDLTVVLMPLSEWMRFIGPFGEVADDCAVSVTMLALMHLDRLTLRP
jgi:8-oxo-dGTP pyrophosphatase MutT (NUDIX family)